MERLKTVLLVALVLLASCKFDHGKPEKKFQYFQDPTTGLCFMNLWGVERAVAHVPCTDKVLGRIKKGGQYHETSLVPKKFHSNHLLGLFLRRSDEPRRGRNARQGWNCIAPLQGGYNKQGYNGMVYKQIPLVKD